MFPAFNQIQVATQTVIVQVAGIFDLKALFEHMPVLPIGTWTDDTGLPLTTGSPNEHLSPGSIVGLSLNSTSRGEATGVFKNSLVVLMYTGPRELSNFKVSRLGKVQVTGVKTPEQFVLPVVHLLRHINGAFGLPPLVSGISLAAGAATPPIQRLAVDPAGPDFAGWQCWAVVAMFNAYVTLPHAANLQKLRDFIIHRPLYEFCVTYEPETHQSMAIKAKSRLTAEEQQVAHHPYFTVLDRDLENTAVIIPQYQLTTDIITHLHAVEQLGMVLTGTRSPPSTLKPHLGTLLTYETKRTFISAPGLEVERLYHDFCSLMTEYYAQSSEDEKRGDGKRSRKKYGRGPQIQTQTHVQAQVPAPAHVQAPTEVQTAPTATDSLRQKMQAMRLRMQQSKVHVGV